MDILKGSVTASRATTAVSGGGNNSGVQTTHILLFKVDSRQAKFSSANPAMISDNDVVVLAGTEKKGAFVALAYRNETTGVVGDVGKLGSVIGMILGFVGALVAFIIFSVPSLGHTPKLIGLGFLVIGFLSAARFTRIKSAVDLLARS